MRRIYMVAGIVVLGIGAATGYYFYHRTCCAPPPDCCALPIGEPPRLDQGK
jgi:hypothetical protein